MKPLIFLMSLLFNITVFGGYFNPGNFTGNNRSFTYSDSNYFVTLYCSSRTLYDAEWADKVSLDILS